ncbi:ABC transporter ATP-binding protein [Archaeoglobales archaeon]|nr:MAG: ABC transporter ATP-binding protein [Archaeoglobales archaeon]
MLRIMNLTKKYGDFVALDTVSFEIKEGEIVGLIGENGAGKSTTIKIIVGLIEPTNGKVEYFGKEFDEDVKKMIGYLPEVDSLYENMDAIEYLTFFASLYNIPDGLAKKKANELLKMLNLQNKQISEFSKGMRRKLAIARTLIHDPKILIYDEPTGGLDPTTSLFIAKLLEELKENKVILFSAHNMYYVESICDKVVILKGGKMLYYGKLDELIDVGIEYTIFYMLNGKKDIFVTSSVDKLNMFVKEIVMNSGKILGVEQKSPRLEDVYFSLVNKI